MGDRSVGARSASGRMRTDASGHVGAGRGGGGLSWLDPEDLGGRWRTAPAELSEITATGGQETGFSTSSPLCFHTSLNQKQVVFASRCPCSCLIPLAGGLGSHVSLQMYCSNSVAQVVLTVGSLPPMVRWPAAPQQTPGSPRGPHCISKGSQLCASLECLIFEGCSAGLGSAVSHVSGWPQGGVVAASWTKPGRLV